MATGTAVLDFGAFPGKSDASVAVTGQGGIVDGSLVEAWIRPVATADHDVDDHLFEMLGIRAGNIVAGTGFTIYGVNTNQLNEPLEAPGIKTGPTASLNIPAPSVGGRGTRLWGTYNVNWAWV